MKNIDLGLKSQSVARFASTTYVDAGRSV